MKIKTLLLFWCWTISLWVDLVLLEFYLLFLPPFQLWPKNTIFKRQKGSILKCRRTNTPFLMPFWLWPKNMDKNKKKTRAPLFQCCVLLLACLLLSPTFFWPAWFSPSPTSSCSFGHPALVSTFLSLCFSCHKHVVFWLQPLILGFSLWNLIYCSLSLCSFCSRKWLPKRCPLIREGVHPIR